MTRQPIVNVLDREENVVTWDSSTVVSVTVSANASAIAAAFLNRDGLTSVTESALLEVTAVGGEARFSSLRFKGSLNYSYSLVVSAANLGSATTTEFQLRPGSLGGFGVVSSPVGGVNGEPLGGNASGVNFPRLQLKDSFGNNITSDSDTVVTARIASGANGSLAGSVSAQAVSGVVSFENLRLSGLVSESYVIEFVSGDVVVSSAAVNLTPAAPTQLSIVSKSATAQAGVYFQPVELQVRDFSGNLVTNHSGVVSVAASGGGVAGILDTTLDAGTLSPRVKIDGRVGTYTVTYRVTFGQTVLTSTHDVNITFGVATQIGIVSQPAVSGTQTGGAFTPQPIVELRDAFGNRVPTAGVVISAVLHNPSTSNVIQKAVLASEAVGAWTESVEAVQAALTVPTATTDANGTATFSDLAVIGLPGYSYQLSFTSGGYASVQSRNFTLSTANPFKLDLVNSGVSSVVAGEQSVGTYVVQLRDRFGNLIVSENSAAVQMRIKVDANDASVGRGGVLIPPVNQTATITFSNGVATFADYKLGGLFGVDYRFQFVSQRLGLITQDSNIVNVTHGAASRLEFSQSPTLVAVGDTFSSAQRPVLRLVDQYGNLVINASGNSFDVTVSPATELTTILPTMTNGVFDLSNVSMLGTPGVDYFMTFTPTGLSGIAPVTTPAFRVAAGAPRSFVVTQNPVGGVTGQLLAAQPAIRLLDASGNPANVIEPITFTLSLNKTGPGVPSLVVTSSPYVANSADFQFDGIKVGGSTAASYSLTITATGLGNYQFSNVTTTNFRVTNDRAAVIEITQEVVANTGDIAAATRVPFDSQPELKLYDAFGNLAENDSSTRIIAVLNGSNATLTGTRVVTAKNGVVEFTNLAVRGSLDNSYTLTFREASQSEIDFFVGGDASVSPIAIAQSNIAIATTRGFRLDPGAAAEIRIENGLGNRQTSGVVGTQPVLRAYDQDNNVASTSQNLLVTATIAGGANGSLQGTDSATFVGGVASFTNLALRGVPGESYTISYAVSSIPVVSQGGVFVNLAPTLTFGYQDMVYSPTGSQSPAVSTQSGGVLTFSVASSSQTVCSVDASTGRVSVLSAGTCLVNLSQSLSNVVVGGETRGAWLAASAQTSFQIAKADQAPLTSLVTSSITVSAPAGSAIANPWRITLPFGAPVVMAFGGGSVTESALVYELTTSPQLANANQMIQPCVRVADTVFPGNVQRVSGVEVAACRVLVTKQGNVNYNPVTTALDIVVMPTNQSTLSMVANPTVVFNSSQRLFASGGNGTGAVTFRVVTGGQNCSVADVDGQPVVLGLAAGSCTIASTKAESTNFNRIESTAQTFNVVKAAQFIRFTSVVPQAPRVKGSPGALAVNFEYAPTAVASSNLRVDLSVAQETDSSGSPIVSACEFDGTKVTFVAPGRCVLVAQQSGNDNYLAAVNQVQVIEVDKLNQTIDFDVVADREFGDPAFQLSATSNAGLPVTFTQSSEVSTESCTVTPGGLVTLGNAGSCEIFAIQEGNERYRAASPVKQVFKVAPKPAAKPFITSVASANQSLLLSFREPSYRGGSAITAYEVVATNVASSSDKVVSYACKPLPVLPPQFDSSGSPIVTPQREVDCEIDGLVNDVDYILTVAAITAFGTGQVSDPASPVKPQPNYSAPQELSAISTTRFATLEWSTPLAIQGEFQSFDIYVRAVGTSEFTRLPSVSTFSATSSAIPLGLLPPAPEPAPEVSVSPSVSDSVVVSESSSLQLPRALPMFFRSFLMSMPFSPFAAQAEVAPVVQRPTLFSVATRSPTALADLGTNYEFMVITVTDELSTSNVINTARVQQQLVTAPSAPSTVSAQPVDRDMFIAWGSSVFDGGANIIDYTVFVNGVQVAVTPVASSTIFANWQYSTTYTVEVKARNEIGYSAAKTFVLTTPEDPTPPVVAVTVSNEIAEVVMRLPSMTTFVPKIVQPGAVVMVTGEKLDRIKSIKIGSVTVEFVLYGPNRLAFKVPMNTVAGVYSVEHFSDFGRVVVQDALTVAGSTVNEELPVTEPNKTESPVVDPDDIDGDGRPTNNDDDIDGDGTVNGEDSDIDGDTIDNGRDPNTVVPNDPSEALPESGENTGNEDSTDSETANPGNGGGLIETNPLAAWIIILIIGLAAAIGAGPALAGARRKKREEELELK